MSNSIDNNTLAFFSLVKAGLWERDVRLLPYGKLDFNVIYRIAEEQSVVGLVAAGLEHVIDVKVSQTTALAFAGKMIQIEQTNLSMNGFISKLIDQLGRIDVYSLLVKGQGVAQCYEKPLWRASGDVDLLLYKNNYNKASDYISSIASSIEEENPYTLHKEFIVSTWSVELHGTLRGGLWTRLDQSLDTIQREIFCQNRVRVWENNAVRVFLPRADEDVFLVFSHILQHFFKGGIGAGCYGHFEKPLILNC